MFRMKKKIEFVGVDPSSVNKSFSLFIPFLRNNSEINKTFQIPQLK